MNSFHFTLRGYQQKAISDVYSLIRKSVKKILIFAPTGGGKTIIATKIVYDAVSRYKQVLFVVHRDILVKQTNDKFASVGLKCGFFKAGWNENIDASIQIASVQTLPNRQKWKALNYDVVIFDECHILAFSKICISMMEETFPNAIYLGLTATPWRLSKQEALGDIYSNIVCTPMPKELIAAGFLVKPSYYGLNYVTDLEKIEIKNGDYDLYQLNRICDRTELIEQLCHSWFELAEGRASIAFAVSVSHADNIANAFKNYGIKAAVVTGKTPLLLRNQFYQELAEGKLKILVSCGALSEGFDVPQVSCVMLARPTKSKALYFQQLGRGLRLADGKRDCLVLDQSQNVMLHGFVEDLKQVKLFNSQSSSHKTSSKPPLKICPKDNGGCGAYISSSRLQCPHCNYNFDLEKAISILGISRLLSDEDKIRLSFYRSLLREAYQKSYAPSWAAVNFKEKYGFFPPFDWAKKAVFDDSSSIEDYRRHLSLIAKRLNKKKGWIEKYLQLEFGISTFSKTK